MPISTLIEKKKISHAYRGSIVTFLAWRYYNSRETTGSPTSSKYEHRRQTALLRNNIRKIRICMGKIFIFVGYRNDRFFSHTNPYISNATQQWGLYEPERDAA